MTVDFNNLLDRGGFEERRRNTLLYAQDDSTPRGYTDGRRTKLDRLERVFNLEQTTFR
jgi:hypothetical protein